MTEAGKARGLSATPMGLGKGVLEKHVLSFFQSHKGHCWERTVEWQCARQPWLSQSGDAKPLHLSSFFEEKKKRKKNNVFFFYQFFENFIHVPTSSLSPTPTPSPRQFPICAAHIPMDISYWREFGLPGATPLKKKNYPTPSTSSQLLPIVPQLGRGSGAL